MISKIDSYRNINKKFRIYSYSVFAVFFLFSCTLFYLNTLGEISNLTAFIFFLFLLVIFIAIIKLFLDPIKRNVFRLSKEIELEKEENKRTHSGIITLVNGERINGEFIESDSSFYSKKDKKEYFKSGILSFEMI